MLYTSWKGLRLKTIFVILFSVTLIVPHASFAKQSTQKRAALYKLLELYGVAIGGWSLEKKCNYFSKDKKKEFEWLVTNMRLFMSDQAPPQQLKAIHSAAARAVAEQDCNEKGENSALQTMVLLRTFNEKFLKSVYNPNTSYGVMIVGRFRAVSYGIDIVMKTCDYWAQAPDRRERAKRYFDVLKSHVQEQYPMQMKLTEGTMEMLRSGFTEADCNSGTQSAFFNTIRELDRLHSNLALIEDYEPLLK